MIKLKWIYIVLGFVSLSLIGCEKLIFDQIDEGTGSNDPKVFLSVTTRAAKPKSALRSSINGETNYEDHVNSLAMMIFKNGSDEMVGEPYFNNNLGSGVSTYAFTVEMKPGDYDFYFIANVHGLETDLAGKSRTEINTYLNSLNNLNSNLYKGATSDLGFPMARVYLNQTIVGGGTVYQPIPFQPQFNAGDEYKVVAEYDESGTVKPYVELIRAVAKLEINLDDISVGIVDKITYHNAFGQYSLTPQASPITVGDIHYVNDEVLTPITGTNNYIYYIPEALISNSVTWATTSVDNKPINYFSITTIGGDVYDVPIITDENITFSENYLAIATGQNGANPNYNIFRNHHYKFTIQIHQNIEIFYTINPWRLVKKQLFMGYGYNVEIDEEGNITVSNTIDDCLPHRIRFQAINGAHFGSTLDQERVFGFSAEGDLGFNWDKLKTTYSEEYTINSDDVAEGTSYLNIYYNEELVKTFTK